MPKTTNTSAAFGASSDWEPRDASKVSTAMVTPSWCGLVWTANPGPPRWTSPTPDDGAHLQPGEHGRMTNDQHFDVAVIGTGAGGGTLGHRIAMSGKRVLWLERGPFLPRELDNWSSEAVFVRGKYLAREQWYDGQGNEFQPEVNYYVGGNTKFYGAALFRLRPGDFGEITHHGGISPAWPISYDELEPFYTEAERLYLVHGSHGEDPSEGPTSAQYAYAPVAHEPRIQQLSDDLEKAGLHPFHLPIGVNLEETAPGQAARSSACIRCTRVDGFPCLVNAKSDSQVICVDPVLGQ